MRGRSSGKTGPPVPGLTRVGGGAIRDSYLSIGNGALLSYRCPPHAYISKFDFPNKERGKRRGKRSRASSCVGEEDRQCCCSRWQ